MNLSELEYRDFLFEEDGDLYMGRVFFTGSIHGPEEHFRLCAQVVFSKAGEANFYDFWVLGDISFEPHPGVSGAYCPYFLTELAGIVKDFQRHVFNHIKDINEERKNAKEQN